MSTAKGRPRAPNNASEETVFVRMTREMKRAVLKAAELAQVNVTEWVREAIRRRLASKD